MEFKDRVRSLRLEHKMTLQEVADSVGLQKAAIYKYEHGLIVNPKRTLIDKLAKLFGVSPAYLMCVDESKREPVKIPILGSVVAGAPLEAIENIIGYEEITPELAAKGEYFALEIKGASMEPKLYEGDIVIIKTQTYCDSGDIAIVLVNGNEATVKKVVFSPSGITLIGFNANVYPPHLYTAEEVQTLPVSIVGKVIESRRRY